MVIYDVNCNDITGLNAGAFENDFNDLIHRIQNKDLNITTSITKLDIRSKLTKAQIKELFQALKNNHTVVELTLRNHSFDGYNLSDAYAHTHYR